MDDRMGKYIEKLRKEKGLTQKELAKRLGISNTAISKWECDCNLPDISMLGPLSKVLDADIMILLGYLNSNGKICDDSKDTKNNSKTKLIFLISCILLLILSLIILATTIFLRRKDSSNNNEVKVYEIASQDPRIRIKGYFIFNEESRMIIIEKLNYQEISRGTSSEIYTNDIKLYINIGADTIYKYKNEEESNKKYKLSELIENLDLEDAESFNTDINLTDIEERFDDVILKIAYLSEEGNNESVEASLSLNQLFI